MNLNIAGRDIALGDALKSRIEQGIEEAVEKYFDRDAMGNVTVSRQGHAFEVDVNLHLPSGINLQASGKASDAHDAFNQTLERLEKRIRRHHRKLKDHHKPGKISEPLLMARNIVLASDENDATNPIPNGDPAPLIIAEAEVALPNLTVADAVFHLELIDNPALMFVHASSGRVNMVYKRPDGHIGWVDPSD